MKRMNQFWGDEWGSAEAASAALMIGALSSGLAGLWNVMAGNSTYIILAIVGGLFLFWLVFKH